MLSYIMDYFENGSLAGLLRDERAVRRAGFASYLVGLMTLFISLRLQDMAAGSLFSFTFFFSLILLLNYMESALVSLFMDMMGHKGSPSSLFYLYGISELGWLLALPAALLSKTANFSFGLALFGIFTLIFFLRLKMIKTIYSVRYKMAFISFLAPYAVSYFLGLAGFIYLIYWIVSLV